MNAFSVLQWTPAKRFFIWWLNWSVASLKLCPKSFPFITYLHEHLSCMTYNNLILLINKVHQCKQWLTRVRHWYASAAETTPLLYRHILLRVWFLLFKPTSCFSADAATYNMANVLHVITVLITASSIVQGKTAKYFYTALKL